ncbi:MAG: BamA/TamA family outer membrane protein [Candidatus Latescibacterota bacterium]
MPKLYIIAVSILIIVLALPVNAPAQDPARFEDRYISLAFDKLRLEAESLPQGKRITQILTERGEPVDEFDLYPQFLNIFHPITKHYIIWQELLFDIGDSYDEALVKESERNLRALQIFNVVAISPFKDEEGVGILVVTKDVWSLKPENDFTLLGSDIEYLYLAVADRNIAGRNKTGRINYRMDKGTHQIGEFFEDPRILGSRWNLSQGFHVVYNRRTHKHEGEYGSMLLHRPLYSLATKWSFYASAGFDRGISREFTGMAVVMIEDRDSGELHPWEYSKQNGWGSLGFTRSYGRANKHNFSASYGLSEEDYQTTGSFLSAGFQQRLEDAFLPQSETVGAIGLGYVTWRPDFRKLYNVNTLGLVEDFRFGHFVSLSLTFANELLGGTTNFVHIDLAATYQWLFLDDNIFSVDLSHNRRIRAHDTVNLSYGAGVRNITPQFWLGRLHMRGTLNLIKDNIDNDTYTLGGNSGLRGFESELLRGVTRITSNVEYRTRPVELKTIYIGGAFFWDSGDVFDENLSDMELLHSLGFGVRLLFPQGDRQVVRLDFAKPLNGPDVGWSAYLSFAAGQAF